MIVSKRYKTKGLINVYAYDTGEMVRFEGELVFWNKETDEHYDLTEEEKILSYGQTCVRREMLIPNAKLVTLIDSGDQEHWLHAWVNMIYVEEII